MARITTRFFRVTAGTENDSTLSEALEHVSGLPLSQRRKSLANGFDARLEYLEPDGQALIKGDITRILKDDFPAKVEGDNLAELDADELGACCAFLYDPVISVLAMQFDPKRISPVRFLAYLRAFKNGFHFMAEPVPDLDAWSKFENGSVRKASFRVAAPEKFEFATDNDLGRSLTSLAKAYSGPYITIEIGMGRKKGKIMEKIKEDVSGLLKSDDVRSATIVTEEDDDPFSLIREVIDHRANIDLPSSPDENAKRRLDVIGAAYATQKQYLYQMFNTNS